MKEERKNKWDSSDKWPEEINRIKSVLSQLPLTETIKWGVPVYTYNGKNVIGVGGFKNYVALIFYNGLMLADPARVLINAQEGTTKSLRQWRFTSMDEIARHENNIVAYTREAIALVEAGVVPKPEKKPEISSEFMEKALDGDSELAQAFSKFSPGKKREFLEYIEEAKREETKFSRFEKIRPMILAGIGLNDRYRKK